MDDRYRVLYQERWINQKFSAPYHLNLGCGPFLMDTQIGIDNAPGLQFDERLKGKKFFMWDLRDGIPAGESTMDSIYTSHFMEHLPTGAVGSFLREMWRVCKPKAQITIVVPHGGSASSCMPDHRSSFEEHFFDVKTVQIFKKLLLIEGFSYKWTDEIQDPKNPFHAMWKADQAAALLHLRNVAREMTVMLRVKK